MTPLEAALVPLIRQVVRLELAERDRPGDTYDSHNLPPDLKSRDRFHRVVRKIPGARKVGRTWVVGREAWREYRASKQGGGEDVAAVVAKMLKS